MTSPTKLTVVERCRISPPPRSVPPTSLPLTFFDIPWLFFFPSQPLFFYDLPTTTARFTQTLLPNLKHSLSLTLRRFFPLAGILVMPSDEEPPHLRYDEDDSIFLTVVEAAAESGEFRNLAGNHRRLAGDFHGLVPALSACGGDSKRLRRRPLLAVQVTVFPESGICMGFTLRQVAADCRTFYNFLSAWSSTSKNSEAHEVDGSVAFHDRSVIRDHGVGLTSAYLKDWWKMRVESPVEDKSINNMIRATFVLGPKEMWGIKKWILSRSGTLFGSTQLLLSPYVVTCAFIWACWMKTHNWPKNDGQIVDHHFGFIAGGITRLSYAVPNTYVGNCVGFGCASAPRNELTGENGIAHAARAIGDTIRRLNGDMLSGARNWISEWKALHGSDLHVMVTGSPKVGLYGLDFGWGRPVKLEEVSIDSTGAISLSESREVVGGIEIGVALTRPKMDDFYSLFNEGLIKYSIVND